MDPVEYEEKLTKCFRYVNFANLKIFKSKNSDRRREGFKIKSLNIFHNLMHGCKITMNDIAVEYSCKC